MSREGEGGEEGERGGGGRGRGGRGRGGRGRGALTQSTVW